MLRAPLRLRCCLFLLLSASSAGFSQGQDAAPHALTLRETLQKTEQTNLDVLLSREAITQALAEAQQARVDLRPSMSASATQERSSSVSVSRGSVTGNAPYNRFDGGVDASYSVFDASKIAAARAATVGVEVRRREYERTLQAVLSAVARAYFSHLRNTDRLAVQRSDVERNSRLLQIARNRLDAGVATQIDVTRADAQLATAEQALLQGQTSVYESELELKRLLALDPASEVRLEPFVLVRTAPTQEPGVLVEGAFSRRAEILQARQLLAQNQLEVRAARFTRLPTLELTADASWVGETPWSDDHDTAWGLGAALSIPIFDGGRSRSLQSLALSRLRAQTLRLRDLDQQVDSEVRFARRDVESRLSQIEVAEKVQSLAQEELRLAQIRLEQGAADNREVIEANDRLVQADDGVVEAVYEYNLSRIEFARARGEVRDILQERAP